MMRMESDSRLKQDDNDLIPEMLLRDMYEMDFEQLKELEGALHDILLIVSEQRTSSTVQVM